MELATGYWGAMVLLTLNEKRVFSELGSGSSTAESLAESLSLDPRALGYLLDAGVGLGVLEHDGESYANTTESELFLVEGSPAFMGGGLKYALDTYPVWGRLPEAISTGEAQVPAEAYLGDDPERTRRFVYAMHDRAKPTALGLSRGLDLRGKRRLLDIAGGSGAYSLIACRQNPELCSVLFDLPAVIDVAREIIEAEGMSQCIELVAGDFHDAEAAFGEGFDAVFLNGVLHRERESFCRTLIARARAAMVEGGRIFISDVMLDEEGHGPLFSTLFAMNMLLTAPGGGAHSTSAHEAWLRDAGFRDVRVTDLPPPATHTLLSAVA